MSNMFPPPKDKNHCSWCQYLERSKNRCSENCDCRKWYWVYPDSCGNCGLGLLHIAYIAGAHPRERKLTCDSCDTPTWAGNPYIVTCPPTFMRCPDCP